MAKQAGDATDYEAAYRLLAAGKMAEAEVILRKILKFDPDDADAFHLLGGGDARDRAGKPRRDRIVAAGHCGNNVTKAKKLGSAVAENVALRPPAGFYGPSGFG